MTKFVLSWNQVAALAANQAIKWQAPWNCHFEGMSIAAGNTLTGEIIVGTQSDTDAYLTTTAFTGATASCTLIEPADLVDGRPMPVPRGTEFVATVDFDAGGGGDVANLQVNLHFSLDGF